SRIPGCAVATGERLDVRKLDQRSGIAWKFFQPRLEQVLGSSPVPACRKVLALLQAPSAVTHFQKVVLQAWWRPRKGTKISRRPRAPVEVYGVRKSVVAIRSRTRP